MVLWINQCQPLLAHVGERIGRVVVPQIPVGLVRLPGHFVSHPEQVLYVGFKPRSTAVIEIDLPPGPVDTQKQQRSTIVLQWTQEVA